MPRYGPGMLSAEFFDRPADEVAVDLVGKVLRRRHGELWLAASIVEAEAYPADRAAHSWLGRTPSRESMWAPPGTIYMYFARGGDSLNVSVRGEGHAVLVKAARPWLDERSGPEALEAMHRLNPLPGGRRRPDHRLLSGQVLLARALDLRVREWDGRRFDPDAFFVEDAGYVPEAVVACPRLGIPEGRDEHLPLRFVDRAHRRSATRPPPRGAVRLPRG